MRAQVFIGFCLWDPSGYWLVLCRLESNHSGPCESQNENGRKSRLLSAVSAKQSGARYLHESVASSSTATSSIAGSTRARILQRTPFDRKRTCVNPFPRRSRRLTA